MTYTVRPIEKRQTHWLLLNVHYAKRIPPISYAFGLFYENELRGVVTYGMPASPSLCKGVAGDHYKSIVLELNRLCLTRNETNEASRLVGKSLAMLPEPTIVVSYADTSQCHTGFVYQATNFIYTGITAKRNEWAVRGLEHLHSKAIANMVSKNGTLSLTAAREQFGDDFYYRPRSQKHRYVFVVANKTRRKQILKALRYPSLPYPKATQDN